MILSQRCGKQTYLLLKLKYIIRVQRIYIFIQAYQEKTTSVQHRNKKNNTIVSKYTKWINHQVFLYEIKTCHTNKKAVSRTKISSIL